MKIRRSVRKVVLWVALAAVAAIAGLAIGQIVLSPALIGHDPGSFELACVEDYGGQPDGEPEDEDTEDGADDAEICTDMTRHPGGLTTVYRHGGWLDADPGRRDRMNVWDRDHAEER